MKQLKFISFEEWLADQPEEIREQKGECSTCNGTGECECSCGDVHDCGKCDGTGESEKSASKEQRKLYEAAKQADLKRWQAFFGVKEAA